MEISGLHAQRPAGVSMHLRTAELKARDLDAFSRDQPSITQNLQLPDCQQSGRMLWPVRQGFNPLVVIPVERGDPRLTTDDWWQVGEEQRAAEEARQKLEAIEADRARREFYRRRN